jgi:hypothetical protein
MYAGGKRRRRIRVAEEYLFWIKGVAITAIQVSIWTCSVRRFGKCDAMRLSCFVWTMSQRSWLSYWEPLFTALHALSWTSQQYSSSSRTQEQCFVAPRIKSQLKVVVVEIEDFMQARRRRRARLSPSSRLEQSIHSCKGELVPFAASLDLLLR